MKLNDWRKAIEELTVLAIQHGHNTIPLPAAMAALQAESRSTFYRRLDEMREAGWFASANERTATLAILSPAEAANEIADEVASLRKGYNE